MQKKELYLSPQVEVLKLTYAEPVCQATSGEVPNFDYDPLNPGDLFPTSLL